MNRRIHSSQLPGTVMLILCLLFTNTLFSQTSEENPVTDPARLIEQVGAFSQKTSSITADFTQEKELSFLEEKVFLEGKFYFQREQKLRWEYTSPFDYLIILNGSRIRIVDEGKVKNYEAGSNRMFLEVSDVMSGLVNGTLLTGDKFSQVWYETADHYRVALLPLEAAMKEYLTKIEMKISKTDFSAEELKMIEKSGDYTLITFWNKKFNDPIPADIFRVD